MALRPLSPDPDELRNLFPPGDWERGGTYFRVGKVVTADFNAAQGLATGRVRGSGGRHYQCLVHLGQTEDGGPMVVGQWSCPVGYNCKPMVAVLLKLNAESAQRPERSAADDLPPEVRAWLSRAEGVAKSLSDEPLHTLVYLVRRDQQSRFQHILVEGVKIRRLLAGGYGKARDFDLSARSRAAFITPEDQRILALIRAERRTGVGQHGRSALRLWRCHGRGDPARGRSGGRSTGPLRDPAPDHPRTGPPAIDRAHRIGQDKPVFVYKLLTEGTVEQKVAELQARKQALADAMLEGGGTIAGSITTEDLDSLFAPVTGP